MIQKVVKVFGTLDEFLKSRRQQLSAFAFLILIAAVGFRIANPTEVNETISPAPALETYIPRGFTLVPIQISNLEQLQSMISDRAVVDLFTLNSELPVAESVRLVRSPLDSNVFGVLIEDEKTKPLLRHGHEFIVVVKNRQSQPRKKRSRKKREIIYEGA